MKNYDIEKLLAEGRRWVVYPGEQDENGVRADIVFENCPLRFEVGCVSNDPSSLPPQYLGPDHTAAWEAAMTFAERVQGISREEWGIIILSSMGADCKARRVSAKRDPQTSEVTIFCGDGEVLITLEEEDAIRLYQQIAQAFELEFTETCQRCNLPLEDGICPNECGTEDEE